ncbi:hypothetical protein [Paraburkholderia phytofirmans]|uniref:hypothetical protein n=1 Tax=Paraburkholderia phytofirmans TaxID=261302 RepID=UPI001EE648FE|nr:hypothetical protein [Paraburkholderia phytofirmans]
MADITLARLGVVRMPCHSRSMDFVPGNPEALGDRRPQVPIVPGAVNEYERISPFHFFTFDSRATIIECSINVEEPERIPAKCPLLCLLAQIGMYCGILPPSSNEISFTPSATFFMIAGLCVTHS